MAYAVCAFDATTEGGIILPGVTVSVRRASTGVLEPLFSDRDGSTPIDNPFTSSDGKVEFYCRGGAFNILLTKGAYSRPLNNKAVGLAAESDDIARPAFYGTIFVIADDGNDVSGDGSDAHPWASWTHIEEILGVSDCRNTDIAIQFKDGDDYAEDVTVFETPFGARSLTFLGNHGTPANIKGLNFFGYERARFAIDGFEVEQINATAGAQIILDNGAMNFVGTDGDIIALDQAFVSAVGLIERVSGNKATHVLSGQRSLVKYLPASTTMLSAPGFSLAYFEAYGGFIFAPLWQSNGSVTGSPTGLKHASIGTGGITTLGDDGLGDTPGEDTSLGGYFD